MKKTLLAVCVATTMYSTAVSAEITIGVGIGALYNGIGINVGSTNNDSLVVGSIGCMGWSSETSTSDSDAGVEQTSDFTTDCGLGFGYVSTATFAGSRHGLGLSLLATENNVDKNAEGSNVQFHVMPGYYYFFSGIDRSGLNLGVGPRFIVSEQKSVDTTLSLNIGFQF